MSNMQTITEAATEQVAKAIFAADYPNDRWERLGAGGHAQTRYLKMAHAAIIAVRELNG